MIDQLVCKQVLVHMARSEQLDVIRAKVETGPGTPALDSDSP